MTTSLKNTLRAALTALALVAAAAAVPTGARAESEGGGEPFPFHATGAAVADVPTQDTGSERLPNLATAYPPVAIVEGDVLPANGREGTVQTANSLPRGGMDGTVTYAQGQSVQRYLAQRQPADPSSAAPTLLAQADRVQRGR